MADFLNKLPIAELTKTANSALTEAANNTTKQLPELNSTLETATKVIQDKPTLEDSVRESLLKVIVNPKFSEQIESDIATVFRPILKMQLEKVGKIIAKADEAKTPEQAKAVKSEIETAIAEAEGSDTNKVIAEKPVANEAVAEEPVANEGSDTNNINLKIEGGSKRKNRNKSRKSLKKSASRGRRTTRRHKRTSR
jgi:flagellar biosynthesis component FlhA